MATFTVRFDLSGYDLTPGDRVSIVAEPLISSYPDPVTGKTYTNRASVATNAQGEANLTLVSLPGLQYEIKSWALGERVIDGDWPDGSVLRWEDLVDVVPSPIQPTDAVALRNELLALIETGAVRGDSAYKVAVDNGFFGTEEEWLESLIGGPADPEMTFAFPSASTTWTCTHNLGKKYVDVVTVDLYDNLVEGEVRYVDNYTLTVSWYYPMSGTARISS